MKIIDGYGWNSHMHWLIKCAETHGEASHANCREMMIQRTRECEKNVADLEKYVASIMVQCEAKQYQKARDIVNDAT